MLIGFLYVIDVFPLFDCSSIIDDISHSITTCCLGWTYARKIFFNTFGIVGISSRYSFISASVLDDMMPLSNYASGSSKLL